MKLLMINFIACHCILGENKVLGLVGGLCQFACYSSCFAGV